MNTHIIENGLAVCGSEENSSADFKGGELPTCADCNELLKTSSFKLQNLQRLSAEEENISNNLYQSENLNDKEKAKYIFRLKGIESEKKKYYPVNPAEEYLMGRLSFKEEETEEIV